jgi:DNA-binding MarR family transcriptional regulator
MGSHNQDGHSRVEHGRQATAVASWGTTDGPVSEVPVRLRQVIGRMGRRLRVTRAGAGLTPSQYEVLMTITQRGPMRLADLAAAEGINPTMLSRIVAKLEASGLVARQQDAADGRVVHLAATEPGRELVAQIRRERTDVLAVALDSLSDDERAALIGALPVLEWVAHLLKDRST